VLYDILIVDKYINPINPAVFNYAIIKPENVLPFIVQVDCYEYAKNPPSEYNVKLSADDMLPVVVLPFIYNVAY